MGWVGGDLEADATGSQLVHRLDQVGLLELGIGNPAGGDALPLSDGEGLVLVPLPVGLGGVAGLCEFEALRLATVIDEHGTAAVADNLVASVQQALVLGCAKRAGATNGTEVGTWQGRWHRPWRGLRCRGLRGRGGRRHGRADRGISKTCGRWRTDRWRWRKSCPAVGTEVARGLGATALANHLVLPPASIQLLVLPAEEARSRPSRLAKPPASRFSVDTTPRSPTPRRRPRPARARAGSRAPACRAGSRTCAAGA